MKKQYELAKIEEIKNIPIINVMDEARPPVRRSSPVRRQVAVVSFFLSLGVAVAFAGFTPRRIEALKKLTLAIKNHPPTASSPGAPGAKVGSVESRGVPRE